LFAEAAACVPGETALSPLRFETTAAAEGASYTSAERLASGALLDRESGMLAGVSLGTALSWRRWRFELAASVLLGTIDYEGQNQIGLPIATQTRLSHVELGLHPIYRIGSTPFFIGPSFESRTIDRRIEPTLLTPGQHETLNQRQLGLLWGARWESSFGLSAELRASVLWAFYSTLEVDFEGAFDNGTLSLPRSDAESAALEVSYVVVPRVSIAAEAKGETFRPAHSASESLTKDGVRVGTYDYPGSVQDQWSVSLGVRTSF
jgi:hypothetical protein